MNTKYLAAYATALLCGVTACTRPAFAPSGMNISSDRSDYTPTARLAVALASLSMSRETIDIVIDSGSLAVPGDVAGGEGGNLVNVYLTALVVAPVQRRKNEALPNPWEAVAESDSQLVVSNIPRGERRAIGAVHLRVRRPQGLDPAEAWLVFRLTGDVIPHVAKVVGQSTRRPPQTEQFRVYACADWNLTTRIDRRRAKVMNASYLKAC